MEHDERSLVKQLKEGHEDAYRVLIDLYQGKLFSIAYGITLDREESLEILQEVFLKVHLNIKSFREDAKLSTWLHRITVNLCLNWQRKIKRRIARVEPRILTDDGEFQADIESGDGTPDELLEESDLRKAFAEKLKNLPEKVRAVFVLRESQGLSYDEIAETLKIRRGTVKSRLFKAREMLKDELKDYLN